MTSHKSEQVSDITHTDELRSFRWPSFDSISSRRSTRVAILGFLLSGAIAALGLGCSAPEETRAPGDTRPNLILITLDTVRADFLGTYLDTEPKRKDRVGTRTPALDSIAASGTRFDLAISSAALTPVSHASILTGLDNREHGLRVLSAPSGYRLPDDVPTLATVMKAAGYETVAVHSAFPVAGIFGFGRDFDVFESFETDLPDGTKGEAWDLKTFQRRSDDTTRLVLEHLKGRREPFFLWVHYWDPHDRKILPPSEFYEDTSRSLVSHLDDRTLTEEEELRLVYATEVVYIDYQIGRLMDELKSRGQLDDSIIVVVADHGQGLGDHDWLHHRILYQEQIRVPLLISIPGHQQVRSVRNLVRSKDIFPTMLDYLGIDAPRPVSGRTLRPLIEGREDSPRIAFASQINGFDLDARMIRRRPNDDFVYVAMDDDWKLIYRPAHPEASELYHIAEDPGELQDLFDERHEHAIRLERELAKASPWVTEPYMTSSGDVDIEKVKGALQALGYVSTDGEASDIPAPDFSWTCPEDPTLRRATRDAPSDCQGPLIPVVDP